MSRVRQFPAKHPVLCAFSLSVLCSLAMMLMLRIAPFGERTFLFEDMKRQYVAFYAHYRNVFHSGENFLYSFRKGLGDGAIGFFAYYLSSPLLLPFSFLPPESYPAAVSILVLVKVALCAATCCAFLTQICPPEPEKPARTAFLLLSSLSWGFSSYLITNLSNTMWIDALILMPLLYLTAQKVMRGAPVWKHALLVAAILCVNYYIAYMTLLFEGIAVLVYLDREKLRNLWRYLGSLLLGAGMSAALTLPTFFSLDGTSKDSLRLGLRVLTPPPTWGEILARLYSRSYDETQIFDGAPPIGAGALLLIPVALCFFSRGRKRGDKIRMAVLYLLMLVSFRLPVLNLIWHAGTEPRGYLFRNAFLFTFLMICCFYLALTDLAEGGISGRDVIIAALMVEALTVIVFLGHYSYLNTLKKVWNILLLLAGAVLLWLLAYGKRRKWFRQGLVAAFLLLQISDLMYGAKRANMQISMEYITRSGFLTMYETAERAAEAIPRDGELFRTETLTPIEQNDAMLIGYNGVTYYGSDVQLAERQFLQKLGYNDNGLYAEYEPGNTRAAEALLGIRYLIDGDSVTERETMPMIVDLAADDAEEDLSGTDPFTYTQRAIHALTGRETQLFIPAEVTQERMDLPEDVQRVVYTVRAQADGRLYFYLADTDEPQNLILNLPDGEELPYGNDSNLSVIELGDFRAGEETTVEIRAYDRALEGRPVFVTEDADALCDELRDVRERGGRIRQITSSHLRAELPAGSAAAALLIPYDEAWHVTSNGQRLTTRRMGDLYMKVLLPEKLSAGNTITLDLTYHPRGLAAGAAVSIVCALCWILIMWRSRKECDMMSFRGRQACK